MTEIVHAVPPTDSGLTPCCGRTPIELPLTDRITSEETVTCPGPLLMPGEWHDAPTADAERYKAEYLRACETIAQMHAAATGHPGEGPTRGVVEDVEDVRLRAERAEAALDQVHHLATRLEEFAENALRDDDRKLYTAIANDIRTRTDHSQAGQQPAPAGHRYLSTGCLHGDHTLPDGRTGHQYCQSATGKAGVKTPAQCKFCSAPCICGCHDQPTPADEARETAVAALANLYGPVADLDHPQHPVNLETTARVLSALHRSAEDTVTRVIDLYESWVHAGPPPLGASMARWWDKRLVELRAALQPDGQQPAPPEHVDWPRLLDGFGALLAAFPADLDPNGPAVRPRPLPAELVARWRDTVRAARKQYANQTTKEN